MKIIVSFILMLVSAAAMGQVTSKEKKGDAEKKAAADRQRSLGGQITDNELKSRGAIARPQNANDSVQEQGTTDNKNVVSSNKDQPQPNSNSQAQKSSAPAVVQSTSSESGSPSILSKDNGSGRDGTNNVQRAKPNIAGAEVPSNMNIDKKNTQSSKANSAANRVSKEHPAALPKDAAQDATTRMNAGKTGEISKDSGDKQSSKKSKSKKKGRRNKDSGK